MAGQEVEVRVPPADDRAAQVEVALDARPIQGLHLTRALLKLNQAGAVVGGTVYGALEISGFFDGTSVSLGILPGGTVAPGVKDVPISAGPIEGTADLELTEAGVSGKGTLHSSNLGLPAWLGIEGGDLDFSFAQGQVLGEGLLKGRKTPHGQATATLTLTDSTLVTEVTFVVTPNLEPIPHVRIEEATLRGTLTQDLCDLNKVDPTSPWSGSTEGGARESSAATPSTTTAQPDNEHIVGGGLSATDDVFGVASGYETPPTSRVGSDSRASSTSSTGSGTAAGESSTSTGTGTGAEGGDIEAPSPRAPDAFLLKGSGTVWVGEWVSGMMDIAYDPVGGTFDASGLLMAKTERSYKDIVTYETEVTLEIHQNVPVTATAKVAFVSERYKLKGYIKGKLDIGDQELQGDVTARTTHHIPIETASGTVRILRYSKVQGRYRDNDLKDLRGKLKVDGELGAGEGEPLKFKGEAEANYDHEGSTFDGQVTAKTLNDYVLTSHGGGGAEGEQAAAGTLLLRKDSEISGHMSTTGFTGVKMAAALRYDRNGAPLLEGRTKDATWDTATGALNGTGTFTLLESQERDIRGGEWKLRLLKGAKVSAEVVDNALTEIGGSITIQVDDSTGPLANGVLSNAKLDLETGEAVGTLKLTTARPFQHPGEGRTLANGYTLTVLENSGISGTLTNDGFTDVGADLRTRIDDAEGSLAYMRIHGTMDLDDNDVSGRGVLSLARQVTVAEGMAGTGWEARLLRGTKAEGFIEDNTFTKVGGRIKAGIYDEDGKFLEVIGEGEWTLADDLLDLEGTVTVSREKMLAEGGENGWSIALRKKKSAAVATLEDDVFTGVKGTIPTLLRRAGKRFANLELSGSWKPESGFQGKGAVDLLNDEKVATVGSNTLWLIKGTGAEVELENEGITELTGYVPARVDEGETKFIQGAVAGTYKLEEKLMSGAGLGDVLVEKKLGQLGGDQLWLVPGSGVVFEMEDNVITELGGQLALSIRDGEGPYAQIALEGTFDAQGESGFSGKGRVTMTRGKQLYTANGYSFWLARGTGAIATLRDNTLTGIEGRIPFQVKDGEGPLIKGRVEGEYKPDSGQISGSGSVFLDRAVEYDLGGGVTLKLLKGSGGEGDVTDSKLERLGGTLSAEIWKDGEGIVRVTAQGEYNVLYNTLTELEGEATILKPISVAGGDILIQNVTGRAAIQNNELVSAGGRGEILVKPLNNMKGTFEVEWSNRGGVEQYAGRGWLEFTLIDHDPETGRRMGGLVFAELKSGGEFTAAGEVDYNINDLIGGKMQVKVDNNLDPILYGDMVVSTNLVEARDLFSLEKDLIPEMAINLPIPGVAVFVGLRGGMKMSAEALKLNARIAVGDWRPLSEDAAVPRFETGLHLGWGMNFNAVVAPYMGLGGNIGFASAQMGVRGEVGVDTPVEVRAGGMLRGSSEGFYGELAVGAGISASASLALVPYIKGQVEGLVDFEEDLDRFEQPLGEIFHFEWGGKYIFGDQQRKEDGPIQRLDIPAVTQRQTSREGRPSLGMGTAGGGTGAVRGGPQIESASAIASGQTLGGHGDMGEVMQTVMDVVAVIEGLGALGELGAMISSALTAGLVFGPAGLIVYIVWEIYQGNIGWDAIKTMVLKLIAAVQAGGRLLNKHMPPWWRSIQDLFSGEKPGLLDAFFGKDDRLREAIHRGDHRVANIPMRVQMVTVMLEGWTGGADEECIIMVLEDAACRGDLPALAELVGVDWILSDLHWSSDTRARELFRATGVRF